MLDTQALNTQVPAEHTIAILQGDTIIHSGMMADSRQRWDDCMLDSNHGIYVYAGRAIDNKWYRIAWAVK